MSKGELYEEFIEKFQPKKTTDDCYTPPETYEVVKDWAFREFGIDEKREIVRPFYPGGDYENAAYPKGCIVLDNPPFSILSKIVKFFNERKIDLFLFAPGLTLFQYLQYANVIIIKSDIIYENGARIKTNFITNLGEYRVQTAPDLDNAIKMVQKSKNSLPAYTYPLEVTSAAKMQQYLRLGRAIRIRSQECRFIRALDAQKKYGKGIYGSGILLSTKAAQVIQAVETELQIEHDPDAHVWELSDRERELIRKMDEEEEKKMNLYRIDYQFGIAKLYTPYSAWEDRFYELANQCVGIRKSIGEVTLLSKSIESPSDKLPGELERLEYSGDVVIWNAAGEKIKSEFD